MATKIDKWSFDKDYLRKLIVRCEKELETGTVSDDKRSIIIDDIKTYKRYIVGKFEMQEEVYENADNLDNIEKIKETILNKMAAQYKILGSELIKWIIMLKEADIFKRIESSYLLTDLSMDEMAELTIRNYEFHSPEFLIPAKEIILDSNIKQIQLVKNIGSYCHHDTLTDKSFLLINLEEPCCILNHETEHAIEYLFGYQSAEYYYELGATLWELLFNDMLHKYKGFLKKGDFDFRLEDAYDSLDNLNDYFKIMLLFAQKNFDISTSEFLDTFITNNFFPRSTIEKYLKEEIENCLMAEEMNYLFSFLKAIELREQVNNKRVNTKQLLESYIDYKDFYFPIPQDGYMPYERYIDEMNERVRKK